MFRFKGIDIRPNMKKTILVHSESARTVGSHIVYRFYWHESSCINIWPMYLKCIYRAFHNVLYNYKHLQPENHRTYLNGTVHSHRKTEKGFFVFLQPELYDVCTACDTAHIDTIFQFLPHTRVNMSASIFFTAAMIRAFSSARSRGNGRTSTFAYFARNARCTVTTALFVWYSNTQNDFSPGAAIFSLHRLASPSGRNVNYDFKKIYLLGKNFSFSVCLYRFRKYLSYGVPMINFCNPGVHYEALCVINFYRYVIVKMLMFLCRLMDWACLAKTWTWTIPLCIAVIQ